jgi:hypothetical protein
METAIRWMAERVEETEGRLRTALNVLQGSAKPLEIPTGIFREVVGDVKSTADVQTLLRIATVDPSSSCTLNDLADVFAKERKMSRDTAKTHIRAVLKDSTIDARKGMPIKVKGLALNTAISHV